MTQAVFDFADAPNTPSVFRLRPTPYVATAASVACIKRYVDRRGRPNSLASASPPTRSWVDWIRKHTDWTAYLVQVGFDPSRPIGTGRYLSVRWPLAVPEVGMAPAGWLGT